jgi:hypothetical protein
MRDAASKLLASFKVPGPCYDIVGWRHCSIVALKDCLEDCILLEASSSIFGSGTENMNPYNARSAAQPDGYEYCYIQIDSYGPHQFC